MGEVYKAIAGVQGALSRAGIAKNRRNTQGSGYNFRGIDDVYNALAPLLAEYGLCILPRMMNREVVERTTGKGTSIFYVTVEAEFDFVAVSDGSKHTVRTFGEAFDTGDKATNKAMSAAYKYAAFQAFAIPTEGDNDADAHTHEVRSAPSMQDHVMAKITGLCEAVGGNQPALICKGYGVDAITDLSPSQADAVIKRLEDKLAEKAKAETAKQAREAA